MAIVSSASPYAKRVAALDTPAIERELDRLQRKLRHYDEALRAVASYSVSTARVVALEAIRKAEMY